MFPDARRALPLLVLVWHARAHPALLRMDGKYRNLLLIDTVPLSYRLLFPYHIVTISLQLFNGYALVVAAYGLWMWWDWDSPYKGTVPLTYRSITLP